jgi:RNA polymerase sigma factor (sigma-70 family)
MLPPLQAVAWRWGRRDGREAISSIWEVLKARFPTGVIPGSNPSAYLHTTVHAEANKFFRRERRLQTRLGRRQLTPLDISGGQEPRVAPPEEEVMDWEWIETLLSGLPEEERALFTWRYGVRGDAVPTREIAEGLRLTRQAVGKRLRRIVGGLRRRAHRDHLAV